jgi:hypothetical protein
LITEQVVTAGEGSEMGAATARSADVAADPPGLGKRVPDAAYAAADEVFEQDLVGEGDELMAALAAASPYIRADEIDRHLPVLAQMDSVAEVIRYFEGQRTLLDLFIN